MTVEEGNARYVRYIFVLYALLSSQRQAKKEISFIVDQSNECLLRATRHHPHAEPLGDNARLRELHARMVLEYCNQVANGDTDAG